VIRSAGSGLHPGGPGRLPEPRFSARLAPLLGETPFHEPCRAGNPLPRIWISFDSCLL